MLSQLESRSTRLISRPKVSSLAPSNQSSTVNSHQTNLYDNTLPQPKRVDLQDETTVEPRLQSMIFYLNKNVSLKSFTHFSNLTLETLINFTILFLHLPFILTANGNDNFNPINNKNYINNKKSQGKS